jgi:hypothetical protein
MDREEQLALTQLIINFMKASSRLEAYLQQGNPLDMLEYNNVVTTITRLQTMLEVWHRKNLPASVTTCGSKES